MKLHLLSLTAVLFSIPAVSALAGPETAPAPDAKDMKGVSSPQMMSESDAGMYIGVFGGANVSQGYANGRTDFTGPGGDFTYHGSNTDHVGGVGGVKVGYNFASMPIGGGQFRLQPAAEFEAYYLGTKTDIHSNFGGTDAFDLRGNMNNGAFMLNGLIRLKTGTFFTPYIGGGIGTEYLTFTRPVIREQGVGDLPADHNANAFAPAAQAIGGFDFEIAKHWDLFTEYKYLVAIDPSLDFGNVGFGNGSYDTKLDPHDIGQHLVVAGLKYSF